MKRLLKTGLLLIAMFAVGRLSAQSEVIATVMMNDGTTQDYYLDENCQIKFGSEDYLWIIRPDSKETIQIALDDIRKITFNDILGTQETNQPNISIFPNPTENQFVINGLTDATTVRIYSIDGRLVQQGQAEDGQRIDISNLNAGLYLVNIGSQNLKLMKL